MISSIKKFLNSGQARSSRAKKNIVAMLFLRGISVLCSLVIVPLTIGYVTKYEYGIWLTISSLVSWLSFFDLGIGNGLRNKFIEAIEKGKHRLAKIYVSTAYAIISMIVSIVWIFAVTISFFLNWCEILNAESSLENEVLWTIVIVITNFSVIFILGLNRTLLNAIQKPAIGSSFDTITQVLLCAVIFILIHTTKGSLIYLACAMGGTSIVVLTISNIWTFHTFLRKYRPSLRQVRLRFSKGIMSMGLQFFFLQIIAIAFYQTNNLIISHYVGPDEVTVYNIAYKYMNVLTMLFSILITPFWSAFAEANVNGDYKWMKNVKKKLMQVVGGIAILGLIMCIISPWFYKFWLDGTAVIVPIAVTILVCGFHLCNIWTTLWTQLLSGFGKIRLQLICSSLCCISYLPLGIWGCKHFGLIGLLVASILSFTFFTSWFGIIQVNKLINRTASGIWDK